MVWTRRSLVTAAAGSVAVSALRAWPGQADNTLYLEAFLFGFAAFEFCRTGAAATAPRAGQPNRINQLVHRSRPLDWTARGVTTPNADTLYSSLRLDLSAGPVRIHLPHVTNRYFSASFLDCFTDNFINVRSDLDPKGVDLLVVSPETADAPSSGAKIIRSPTADCWMLARIDPFGVDGLAIAQRLQQQVGVEAPSTRGFPVTATDMSDPTNFVAVLNACLARGAVGGTYRRRAARFAPVGVRPVVEPEGATLSDLQRAEWVAAIAQGSALIKGGWRPARIDHGWEVPPRSFGRYGADDRLRASVALTGLGALALDEAEYAYARVDANGAPLDGASTYRLTLPRDVPVAAFWSVSLYQREPDGRLFFARNALDRYSINSRSETLRRHADGSVTIAIQPGEPRDGLANWAPTPPGPMVAVFRAYRPGAALTDGRWRLPPIIPSPPL